MNHNDRKELNTVIRKSIQIRRTSDLAGKLHDEIVEDLSNISDEVIELIDLVYNLSMWIPQSRRQTMKLSKKNKGGEIK